MTDTSSDVLPGLADLTLEQRSRIEAANQKEISDGILARHFVVNVESQVLTELAFAHAIRVWPALRAALNRMKTEAAVAAQVQRFQDEPNVVSLPVQLPGPDLRLLLGLT